MCLSRRPAAEAGAAGSATAVVWEGVRLGGGHVLSQFDAKGSSGGGGTTLRTQNIQGEGSQQPLLPSKPQAGWLLAAGLLRGSAFGLWPGPALLF